MGILLSDSKPLARRSAEREGGKPRRRHPV